MHRSTHEPLGLSVYSVPVDRWVNLFDTARFQKWFFIYIQIVGAPPSDGFYLLQLAIMKWVFLFSQFIHFL
jgi:hypothetical protein